MGKYDFIVIIVSMLGDQGGMMIGHLEGVVLEDFVRGCVSPHAHGGVQSMCQLGYCLDRTTDEST